MRATGFRAIFLKSFVAAAFLSGLSAAGAAQSDPAVLKADQQFVHAAAKSDSAALAKLLDKEFTWSDANGLTLSVAAVLHAVPKDALGDETGVNLTERPDGSRPLVSPEVAQPAQPSTSAGSGVKECENPCKTVPSQPANDAEP